MYEIVWAAANSVTASTVNLAPSHLIEKPAREPSSVLAALLDGFNCCAVIMISTPREGVAPDVEHVHHTDSSPQEIWQGRHHRH